jgi:hypothetical protein
VRRNPSEALRTFNRSGKKLKLSLGIKKFHRKNPKGRKEEIKKLKEMTRHVVEKTGRVVSSLYRRGLRNRDGNSIVWFLSERKIVNQTEEGSLRHLPRKRFTPFMSRNVP